MASMESDLLVDLHAKNHIQFGKFTLKSGQISPIYVDLRQLITYREIRKKAIKALCEAVTKAGIEFEYVCGVPYGALLLADAIAESLGKLTIIKRKEAKSYGKKEMFLGSFVPGKRVIIIEDVVTSGSSIMETVDEINKVGLICEHVFCIVDREQGGVERLKREGLELHSLIRMDSILDFLVNVRLIDVDKRASIAEQLKNPTYVIAQPTAKNDKFDWGLQARLSQFPEGSLNRRLMDIMVEKKSNLCLALDKCGKDRILEIVGNVKENICALKLHCDTIDDWDLEFATRLRQLADDHKFLLFEDRKLADSANTMQLQLQKGLFRIAEWADLVTIYPQPGQKSIEALRSIVESPSTRLSGFLMLAELSMEGTKKSVQDAVEMAKGLGLNLVSGFICQKRCHTDPAFLYWTPGVNLTASSDGKGQCWRGPEQAILKDGCDIVIVGRGITEAADIANESRRYAKAVWEEWSKR